MIQGHLEQLVGRDLFTLSQGKKFKVERVMPKTKRQVEWLMELTVGEKGNKQLIYITDILRVYTWLVSNYWDKWARITDVENFISSHQEIVSKKNASYMMAILATFDDVEHREGQGAAIKFVPKSATYKR
jgi:hypothetical protein